MSAYGSESAGSADGLLRSSELRMFDSMFADSSTSPTLPASQLPDHCDADGLSYSTRNLINDFDTVSRDLPGSYFQEFIMIPSDIQNLRVRVHQDFCL